MKVVTAAKTIVLRGASALGYEIRRRPTKPEPHYLEHDSNYAEIIRAVQPYTLTSFERIASVVDAARYVARRKIPGAIVECGVWRGGSAMAAAMALRAEGDIRDLYLFDTFTGMTKPTGDDIDFRGNLASQQYVGNDTGTDTNWCYADLDDVQRNLGKVDYPVSKIHFIRGDVLETLPRECPDQIALLRLDTDWYESTRHEMEHLYPRLTPGGVLIVDDYGHWSGCQKAIDEYFGVSAPMLCRIDYTGRLTVKPISS